MIIVVLIIPIFYYQIVLNIIYFIKNCYISLLSIIINNIEAAFLFHVMFQLLLYHVYQTFN